MAINRYCYLTCRKLPPFFSHRGKFAWSKIETVTEVDQIEHPSIRGCLQYLNEDCGLAINHDGDLPARSGMGSSASFTVGLLNALHALRGEIVSKRRLAVEAIEVDQDFVGDNCGIQDQVACLPAGTQVLINLQDTKSIEEIKVGDTVLSYNTGNGEKEIKRVVRVFERESKGYIELKFSNNNKLELTAEHPVYVVNKGWVPAGELIEGDKVIQKKYRSLAFRCYNLGFDSEAKAEIVRRTWIGADARRAALAELSKTLWAKGVLNKELCRNNSLRQWREAPPELAAKWKKRSADMLRSIRGMGQTPEAIAKQRATFLRRASDPNDLEYREYRRLQREATIIRNKRLADCPVRRQKSRDAMLLKWADPVFASNQLQRMRSNLPNSLERRFGNLLEQELPGEYRYVGNGAIWIAGKNPDFFNARGKKKIIELFGNFWHKEADIAERQAHFERHGGYQTLCLWESEIEKDPKAAIGRAVEFTFNPAVEIVGVTSITAYEKVQPVYNIEVADNNNYFAYGILVHNCAFGGFNRIDFYGSRESFEVKPATIAPETEDLLLDHMMLFYTGVARTASEVAASQIAEMGNKKAEMADLVALVDEAWDALASGDVLSIGPLLHESWMIKRSLSPVITNSFVDSLYERARKIGATGGKLCGAGAGGAILIFINPDLRPVALETFGDLVHIPFRIDRGGSQVVYYQGER